MLKQIDFKAWIPHIIAVLLLYIVPLIYFSPAIEGYSLVQGDISSFKGMSKSTHDHRETYEEEPLWTNALFGGMPAYQVSVVYGSNLFYHIDRFVINKLFINGPHNLLCVAGICFYILMLVLGVGPWLAILGSFGFMLSSYFPILIEAGHNSKLHAIGYLPAALAGFILTYRGKLMKGGLIFAVFMSFEILSNHIQVTYYFAMMLIVFGCYFLVDAIKNKTIPDFVKRTSVIVIAGVIAILCNADMLWNTYQYTKESMRGKSELTIAPNGQKNENQTSGLDIDYLTQWSYGISETWSLIVPEIKGGASGAAEYERGRQINSYWGDQPFTSGPVYVGAFLLFLFLISFFVLDGVYRWPILISTILFFLVAWGRNAMWFTELLVDYLPLYNKFRTPSMALLIIELMVPMSAMLVLNKFYQKPELLKDKDLKKKLLIAGGSFIGVVLIIGLIPGTLFDFFSPQEMQQFDKMLAGANASQGSKMMEQIEEYRIGVVRGDAFRSIFIILLGGAISWYFIKKQQLKILAISLAVLIIGDLWMIDKRYVSNEKKRGKYERWVKLKPYYYEHLPNTADESILNGTVALKPDLGQIIEQSVSEKRKGLSVKQKSNLNYIVNNERYRVYNQNTNFRVFQINNPFNESRTSFFHKSVGGYSAVKMGNYQDFIDFYLNQELQSIIGSLKNGGQDIIQVLSERKYLNMMNTKYIIYNPDAPAIENPYAYGNAWFVQSVKLVESADEEILALKELNLDKQAVIQSAFADKIGGIKSGGNGAIELISYKDNELIYSCKANKDGFAVFSEIFYENGWNVYIDGKLTPHAKVNYILRGLNVPAGAKEIVFKFEPESFKRSSMVSLASSGLLMLLLFGFLFSQLKNLPEQKA